MKRLLTYYPLSLVCIALTWYLCLFKPPSVDFMSFKDSDKWAHTVMYLGTCSIIWLEYRRRHAKLYWQRLIVWAVAAPIAMSGLIEWAQASLTTYRSGDVADFLANTLGVVLAIPVGIWLVPRLLSHFKRNTPN